MQAAEIILRVRSSKGMNRFQVQPQRETFGALKQRIAQILERTPADFTLHEEDQNGRQISIPDATLLTNFPVFKDGLLVFVKEKPLANPPDLTKKLSRQQSASQQSPTKGAAQKAAGPQRMLSERCNHAPEGCCTNCIIIKPDVKPQNGKAGAGAPGAADAAASQGLSSKCLHGPGGRCLNCLTEKKLNPDEQKQRDIEQFCTCVPGQQKCIHCVNKEYIHNVKHVAFDEYLADKSKKCQGQHPPDAKCNNCLPPSEIDYKLKRECPSGNHQPWPRGMCQRCLPPTVICKQQHYRHVDYAQFMNSEEIGQLVQAWAKTGYTEQRLAYLYGYYAEDPNYKGGVRAVIEAIYEPPQRGDYSHVEELPDPNAAHIDNVVHALQLERIGWLYTTISQDVIIDSQTMRKIARMQDEYKSIHSSGYPVSKYITVVLRAASDQAVQKGIAPEVYMVSDQAMALEKAGVFQDSDKRKMMQIRRPKEGEEPVPSVLYKGAAVTEFEPEFLLVNIAHGHPQHKRFNILKAHDFPRDKQTEAEVKAYFKRHQKDKSFERFGNFALLVYLSKVIDRDTAFAIAQSVEREQEINAHTEQLVKQVLKL